MGWINYITRVFYFSRGNNNDPCLDLSNGDSTEPEENASLLSELPGVLDLLNESIKRFNQIAQEQQNSILQQSSSLHQVAVTSEEFMAVARNISGNVSSLEQSMAHSRERCKSGSNTLQGALKDMEKMRLQVESLVASIQGLEKYNRQIAGVAELISKITDQLNLLALNAQIEAAGTHLHGKRFAVVAREVKRLSDTSKDSTANIQKIIGKVLGDIGYLTDSAQNTLQATRQSLLDMNKVAEDIKNIHQEIHRIHDMTQDIKTSIHQQTAAQEELSKSIAELDSLTFQNSENISKEVREAINNLSDLAQYLTLILETTVLKSQ